MAGFGAYRFVFLFKYYYDVPVMENVLSGVCGTVGRVKGLHSVSEDNIRMDLKQYGMV
jgi:hypothetical protein